MCDSSKPSIRSLEPAAAAAASRGHQADELRADHLRSAPRASSSIRATISCSDAASQSSTFIDTWTMAGARELEPERSHAREPARPARARPSAISRAASSRAAQVHVERDQRPAGADDHAARRGIELRRAEVGNELARVEAALRAPRPRRAGRTPGRAPAVRRRTPGSPSAPSRSAERERRQPRPLHVGLPIGTIGTTSAAPIRGCAPSWRRRSIRSRATSIAATSASTSAVVLCRRP